MEGREEGMLIVIEILIAIHAKCRMNKVIEDMTAKDLDMGIIGTLDSSKILQCRIHKIIKDIAIKGLGMLIIGTLVSSKILRYRTNKVIEDMTTRDLLTGMLGTLGNYELHQCNLLMAQSMEGRGEILCQ